MEWSKKQVQRRWLKKLMRLHMVVTGFSLGAYFLVAFFDPGFLSYDLRQKYHALADEVISVTATVLDAPVKPVVAITAQCVANTLSLELDWADDANTYTYDIDRDGLPLVTGISSSGYSDTAVALGTSYVYTVTARGPMGPGFAVSDPVSMTTLSVCETIITPTITLTSFDSRSVDLYGGTPRVFDRRPTFSGTTNIPNAIIQVVVGPPSSFLSEFTANSNGYFSWQPPLNLSFGTQLFTVTVIDPNDSSRKASTSLQFEIKEKNNSSGGNTKKEVSLDTVKTIMPPVGESEMQAPVDFSLSVSNSEKKIFQGEALNIVFFIKSIASKYQNTRIPVHYSVVDSEGNVIATLTEEELFQREAEIRKQLNLPAFLTSGKYFVWTEVSFDKINVSRMDSFTVVDVPILNLGGGTIVTYAEVTRNIGWITLTLLVLLLFWLFLFMREYGMYLRALRHIAEQQLMNAGFITKRREGKK